MSKQRPIVAASAIVALALGYELVVGLLAVRDPIAAATQSETGTLALALIALGLRIFLLGFAPAWACWAGALFLHAAWQRRR
jgi:hypothetical protein